MNTQASSMNFDGNSKEALRSLQAQRPGHMGPVTAWMDWLLALAAALFSLAFHGYDFGVENQRIQLPHLFWLQDKSLFPGDPLIEAMRSYFSFFWPGMAWLTERLPMEPTFLVGHVLTNTLRLAGVLALGRCLFWRQAWDLNGAGHAQPGQFKFGSKALPRAAWIGLLLVFLGETVIGYESLNWSYFAHTGVAAALSVWSLIAGLRGRWWVALLIAGLIFNIQAMQSAYLLMLLGAAALPEWRTVWKKMLPGAVFYALAAAPGIWWMLQVSAVASPDDLPELVRTYFPAHFFASSFGPFQWIALVGFLGLWFVAMRWLDLNLAVCRALLMCAVIFAFWLVCGAIMHWAPNGFVLKLHAFRASAFLCLLLYVLAGGWIARAWQGLRARGSSFLWITSLLLLAVFASSLTLFDPRGELLSPSLASGAFALWVLLSSYLAWQAWKAKPQSHALAGITLLAALLLTGLSIQKRWQDTQRTKDPLWQEVQEWARDNSAPDQRFLTPPYHSGFRVHSMRPVVGEIQDSSAILWSTDYINFWRPWFTDMGGEIGNYSERSWDQVQRGWFEKTQSDIEALGQKYNANFVVLRSARAKELARGWSLDWTGNALFDNGVFQVYALPKRGS